VCQGFRSDQIAPRARYLSAARLRDVSCCTPANHHNERGQMKLINWVQFTWDLAALPGDAPELPEHYQISRATEEDEKELRRVVTASFALDPEWNTTLQEVMQAVESWLDFTLAADASGCLVLRHGARIIGGSVLSIRPDAANHLSPGPCVLMEYRNRGFGTHLLARSLFALRDSGIQRAVAIAKENSAVTKFLFTKFNGVPSPHGASPLLAA
jgi:N-acetylglutamate synthase-like GNAT family acetyltransferase